MAPLKIMVIHPGHSFSTSDVYDGLCWGLRANSVEVVEHRWDQHLKPLNQLVVAAQAAEFIAPERAEEFQQFMGWLASGDTLSVALEHEVNAVVVVNGLLFPPERAASLRRLGIPVACWGTEAPYLEREERGIAPAYSHWFTQERASVARYADLVPSSYLPLAYNPAVHQVGATDPHKEVDAVFVGGGYPERKALLNGVNWATGGPDGRRITHARVGTLWNMDLDAEAAKGQRPGQNAGYSRGAVPNEVCAAWHRSARIALNLHRRMTTVEELGQIPAGLAESCNPRIYEVPAVGGFLLTDARPELADVLGDTAATYNPDDPADLERQLHYWLAHPDRREAQALAQYEAVTPHHYGERARTLCEALFT